MNLERGGRCASAVLRSGGPGSGTLADQLFRMFYSGWATDKANSVSHGSQWPLYSYTPAASTANLPTIQFIRYEKQRGEGQ